MHIPFVGHLTLSDAITLAFVCLCILLLIRAEISTSRRSNGDWSAFVFVPAAAVIAGVLNFAVNSFYSGVAHAWKFALLWPGILVLPLVIWWGISRVVVFCTSGAARKERHAQKRRQQHLEDHHDEILAELRTMSDAYKLNKPANLE